MRIDKVSEARQTIVITGAAGGIGSEIARQFVLQHDCNLVLIEHPSVGSVLGSLQNKLIALNRNKFRYSRALTIGTISVRRVDVVDAKAVQGAAESIILEFGRIDVLINAAGIMPREMNPFVKVDLEEMHQVMEVNYFGTVNWCHTVLPYMQKAGYGRIVNFSSVVALKGDAGNAGYAASKAAVAQLTKTLAIEAPFDRNNKETGALDITVNAVCPGITETQMTKDLPEAGLARYLARNPQHRKITPAEVAYAVLFLASREASAINGVCLAIDGGYIVGS